MIAHAEVERALQLVPKTGINDVALRVVPVNGEYNVGVFVVRRSVLNGKLAVDAYQHHDITEIYQVVTGSGTLVTGGTLEASKEISPSDPSVVRLMGPTAQGAAINGGTSRRIGPGDIVIIPANTPHGFADLAPEGIAYMLIRVDAHRVLPAR
jgi:mannose-6-phosphate isomerase-like protein (cupin superfamily)